MIGQGDGFHRTYAAALEGGEETRRMADSCHRHHVVQRRRIPAFTGQQIHRQPGTKLHRYLSRAGETAVNDNRIHAAQTRSALAHRTRRQPPAVTKTTYAVNHHNLFVTRQLIVLQTIIRDDKLKIVGGEQRLNRIAAYRRDGNRRAGTLINKHRLIARFPGMRIHIKQQRIVRGFSAIAA